jgi:GTP pyrophosphokinase
MNPTMVAPRNLESLLLSLPEFSFTDRSFVERAYRFAEQAHAGQVRKSGDPYITHPLEVACILAEMHMDAETLAAALLHDVVEDCKSITLDDLQREFGDTVATIVDGVTKLDRVPINTDIDPRRRTADRDAEYIRKMLTGMGEDVRVVLVKLADRLHNMRTLSHMAPEKQVKISQETLDIFAPLANRLGIWQIKWELEDLAFRYLEPDAYRRLAALIDERRGDRENYLRKVIAILREKLDEAGMADAELSGRPKHIYSIHKKMQRKGVDFDKVYDVRAVRVIVNDKVQCYQALGIVHSLWRPIPGEFDDYIASPKDNFYQSLHTAVRDNDGKTLEVQIRTRGMHEHAEYGIAAHWRYKEGKDGARDEAYERRIEYIRRLMEEVGKSGEASEFMEDMKNDVFKDRVYAVTPKGDVVDMAAGATPIDFAYHIHTDLGHRCRGAKVNGQNVTLNHVLKTGDQVEIIATKQGGPSLDWLNPDLGYVNTPRARQKVKYWFRKQHRDRNIAAGRDMLEREMKKLGVLSSMQLEQVAGFFNYDRVDDLLAMIGAGEITGRDIANHVLEHEKPKITSITQEVEAFKPRPAPLVVDVSNGVSIQGMGGMMVTLSKCCHPVPGDSVVGFITRGRGVAVHRQSCPNMVNLAETERSRLIEVDWGSAQQELVYPVPLEVVAYDREGLLKDMTMLIADERINISHVSVDTSQGIATIRLTLQINNMSQLSRTLTRIERIRSVVEVHRLLN